MARIYQLNDGAEWGDLLYWDVLLGGANASVSNTFAHGGLWSYKANGTPGSFQKNLPSALSEFYGRMWIRITTVNAGITFVTMRNAATTLGLIRLNVSTFKLEVVTSTGTLVATGTRSLLLDTWYRLEWHWKIADAGGIFDVMVDGISDATFTGDTKPGTATNADNLVFGAASGSTFYFDDLGFNDTTGVVDNSWVGDGKYLAMMKPNADGDTTQWANSAGTSVNNWDYVNNVPPNSAIYIENSTAGQSNLMNLETVDITGYTVLRVQVKARAWDTVGANQIKLKLKTGGTAHDSSALTLTTSPTSQIGPEYTTNPTAGGAWTQAQLNALQVGPETV